MGCDATAATKNEILMMSGAPELSGAEFADSKSIHFPPRESSHTGSECAAPLARSEPSAVCTTRNPAHTSAMRSLASTLAAALFCAAPLCAASSASVVAEKSSAQRAGEQLLSQLKAQGTCGTAGVDLSSLTQTTGATDYSYSDKDGHNTWYGQALCLISGWRAAFSCLEFCFRFSQVTLDFSALLLLLFSFFLHSGM
jgi:hypothetical protein